MSFQSNQPLVQILEQCHMKKLMAYVRTGQYIHIRNAYEQNLLVFLLQQQQHDVKHTLIHKRFRIFQYLIVDCNLSIHRLDSFGKNLFNWAAHLNCTREALFLLRLYPGDVDMLHCDRSGSCSLHYAVEHGNEQLVTAICQYLVRYRLRFDVRDAYGNTPNELAEKLAFEQLANILSQASRLTVYMSNESHRENTTPVLTHIDHADYFHAIEQRIHKAKYVHDWQTVVFLRNIQKQPDMERINKIRTSLFLVSIDNYYRDCFYSGRSFAYRTENTDGNVCRCIPTVDTLSNENRSFQANAAIIRTSIVAIIAAIVCTSVFVNDEQQYSSIIDGTA
jgi:hypothetical protein